MLGPTRASCLRFLSLESAIGDALKNRVEWLLEYHAGRVHTGSRVSDEPEAVCKSDSDAAGILFALVYLLLFLPFVRLRASPYPPLPTYMYVLASFGSCCKVGGAISAQGGLIS